MLNYSGSRIRNEKVSGIKPIPANIWKTVTKLVASPMYPKSGVAIPPILMASPNVTPEAKPILFGK